MSRKCSHPWLEIFPAIIVLCLCQAHRADAYSLTEDSELPRIDSLRTVGLGSFPLALACPSGGCFMTPCSYGLQIWSMEGRLISAPIQGVEVQARWSDDGSRIAANLANGSYWILSREGRTLLRRGSGDGIPAGYVDWAGDDPVVMVRHNPVDSSDKPRLSVWGIVNASLIREIELPGTMIHVSWSHHSNLLAVSFMGSDLCVYDAGDWSVAEKIQVGEWTSFPTWSWDDKKLAWASFPGSTQARIYLWDVQNGSLTKTYLEGSGVFSMAWSPDGSLLSAVVDYGWRIRIYDGIALQPVASMRSPSQIVQGHHSWSGDGSVVLTTSDDGAVMGWEADSLQPQVLWRTVCPIAGVKCAGMGRMALGLSNGTLVLASTEPDTDWVMAQIQGGEAISAMACSPDGLTVAVGYETGLIALWSASGVLEGSWTGHQGSVRDLGWSPEGSLVATVGEDGRLAVWSWEGYDVASRSLTDPVSLAWSPKGDMIATGHGDGTTRVWSYPGFESVPSPFRQGPFIALEWVNPQFQPDLELLAGCGGGGCLAWDALGKKSYYEKFELHRGPVTDLAFSPDGSRLATCSMDGDVRIWDMSYFEDALGRRTAGELLETLSTGDGLLSLDWLPDSSSLVASSQSGVLYRWELEERLVFTMTNHSSAIYGLSWSPDSRSLVFGGWQAGLSVYLVDRGVVESLDIAGVPRQRAVQSVDWSPDGAKIAFAGPDRYVRVVGLDAMVRFQCAHDEYVTWVEWSPDSQYLASCSFDRTIRIWDGSSGSLLVTLTGHKQPVSSVCWSPDGRALASCSYDGEIMLWDLRSGTCYRTLKPSSGPAYQASWSPDGDLIAAICGGAAGEDSLFFLDSQGQVIRSVAAARVSARVSWSPEGSFLALGCSSGAERVITVFSRSGMPLCNLGGRGGGEIVEWDRTARYVATGGSDGILAFYDAAAIREIRELFWEWAVGSGIFMLFFVSRFLTGFGLLEM